MQGLSSRAHAFSVEALVGKPCKRMKVCEGLEPISAPDRGPDRSAFTGEMETRETSRTSGPTLCATSQRKTAGSAAAPSRRSEPQLQSSSGPQSQRLRSEEEEETEEAAAGGEENEPRESGCRSDKEIRVELQGSELWKRFYEIGTEMIITKAGRRMFPSVRVKVRHLEPCQQYYVAMDVMPVDSKRYRYVYHSSQWMVAGNTDHSCITPRLYVHPDSPCAGETWMRQVISFDRVKLTNNEMDDKGHIILQSMHKYKPRVHIIRHDPRVDLSQIQSLPAEGVHSFSFPETEFTTVTAYQNQQITKLKIDRNPFAKGFRDPGRNRGVLDGLLESYPWRSPLSLDLKPFTIQLQGSSSSLSSSVKNLLPLSSSPSLHPFSLSTLSCQDSSLPTIALPLYGKASVASPGLPPQHGRAFSSLGADKLLTDLPLFSALPGKKPPHSKDPCLRGFPGTTPCLIPLHGPLHPQAPSLFPHLSDAVAPYCLYRYSLPLGPQITALAQHTKLTEDATDCLLRQPPWHPAPTATSTPASPTTNHCL